MISVAGISLINAMNVDASLLGALRCFDAAGRHLSFTQAAAELHLTQSAVSQQMRHLENRLGYALFVRGHRRLVLTDKGQALLQTVAPAVRSIAQTLERLGADTAPLQLSCIPSLALHWLMPRLADFQRLHPDVPLRLSAEFQAPQGFAEDAPGVDVSLRYDSTAELPPQAEPLLQEWLLPVASPDYLARHPQLAAGVLDGVSLLHDAAPWSGAPPLAEWRHWLAQARPALLERLDTLDNQQFNLSSLAITAALHHGGLAMARTVLVQEELRSGRLVPVWPQPVASPAAYALLCRHPQDPRCQKLAQWLRTECQTFVAWRQQQLGL